MADYIRRDTLIEDIDEAVKHRGMGEIIGQTLRRYILRQPAADVAEVVRCKDCEYVRPTINVHTGEQAGIWCDLHDIINVSPDDYCSRGEKKGGRPCD